MEVAVISPKEWKHIYDNATVSNDINTYWLIIELNNECDKMYALVNGDMKDQQRAIMKWGVK